MNGDRRRARLADIQRIADSLREPIEAPDFTASILARVDREREFLPKPTQRLMVVCRWVAAAATALVMASIVVVQLKAPDVRAMAIAKDEQPDALTPAIDLFAANASEGFATVRHVLRPTERLEGEDAAGRSIIFATFGERTIELECREYRTRSGPPIFVCRAAGSRDPQARLGFEDSCAASESGRVEWAIYEEGASGGLVATWRGNRMAPTVPILLVDHSMMDVPATVPAAYVSYTGPGMPAALMGSRGSLGNFRQLTPFSYGPGMPAKPVRAGVCAPTLVDGLAPVLSGQFVDDGVMVR